MGHFKHAHVSYMKTQTSPTSIGTVNTSGTTHENNILNQTCSYMQAIQKCTHEEPSADSTITKA